jgi:hypothetical protein
MEKNLIRTTQTTQYCFTVHVVQIGGHCVYLSLGHKATNPQAGAECKKQQRVWEKDTCNSRVKGMNVMQLKTALMLCYFIS